MELDISKLTQHKPMSYTIGCSALIIPGLTLIVSERYHDFLTIGIEKILLLSLILSLPFFLISLVAYIILGIKQKDILSQFLQVSIKTYFTFFSMKLINIIFLLFSGITLMTTYYHLLYVYAAVTLIVTLYWRLLKDEDQPLQIEEMLRKSIKKK
ncbi:hypothetical protein H6504_01575 [Candidatus Woesearchaeota archaeon]|nr:hypothetical protein [Candidatus Woesearchaeota archaeon]